MTADLRRIDVRPRSTGKERDSETNLDYFGARYFSGAQGRFTSPDPEIGGGHLPDPQSWNMYSYGRNNPLLYTDPDGRNYTVCDSTGANCSNLTDPQYNQYLASIQDSNISVSPSGNINYQNADGSVTTTGSATYYNERAENAVGFLNFGITTLALNYLEVAGPLINSFRAGRAFIAIGLAGAAESASVAVRAAEISGVVAKAAAAVGNESVQASSRAVAEGAAKEFIGPGSRPIFSRATGQAVGEVSADGSKIARYTSADKAQPYINLENKATGGNLHVRW
jgi:RHS repeat-associated protein